MSYTIYCLKDPRTNEVKYVGVTELPLHLRLDNHVGDTYSDGHSPRVEWLRELKAIGLKPVIRRITIVHTSDSREAAVQEDEWIDRFREQGCDLLNVRSGGGGLGQTGSLSDWAMDNLGKTSDVLIAEHEGKHPNTIGYWRRKFDIQAYSLPPGQRFEDLEPISEVEAKYDSLLFPVRVRKFVNKMRREWKDAGYPMNPRLFDELIAFVHEEKEVIAGNPKEETIYEMLDQLISELEEERDRKFPEEA